VSRFKVYIKPFKEDGDYEAEWVDVSDDVELSGVSVAKQSLDNNEYDVGVFRNSGVTLALTNIAGRYSDVGEPGSIFKFRRSNSLVRITWQIMHHDVKCGFFTCGNVALSDEVTIFEGLLDDRALKQGAEEQNLKFKVLGKEAILDETLVDFSVLSNGDTFEQIIFKLLDQDQITEVLTVDAININCQTDLAVDDVTSLENKTVKEALALILQYSNSVLYVKDDVIYVSPRNASADLKFTFYGQGSRVGVENILDIVDYRKGLNRVFNFVTWRETDLYSEEFSSVQSYGVQKKEIETALITDTTKRQNILNAIRTEFGNPKREMILKAPITYETITLGVLDKVAVDYPNIAISDVGELPLWDISKWDQARFPFEVLPISIESTARFKILSRDVDPNNHELIFNLREV
jgi:hypothetical protein